MELLNKYKYQLVIAAAIMAVYGQCVFFEFQHWDDGTYLLNNPYLKECSWRSLKAIFTPGAMPKESLYIPISYLSFLPEGALFGFNSSVAHGVNIILHICNCLLVFTILNKILGTPSLSIMSNDVTSLALVPLLAALIFALHPIQAESVAWAFSRRELLGALFTLLSALFYLKFSLNEKRELLAASLGCFVLAALSKPNMMLVPLIFPVFHLLRRPHRQLIDLQGCSPSSPPDHNSQVTDIRPPIPLLSLIPFLLVMVAAYFLNSNSAGDRPELLATLGYFPYVSHEWLLRLFCISPPQPFYTWNALDPSLISGMFLIIPCIAVVAGIALFRAKAYLPFFMLVFFLLSIAPAGQILLMRNRDFFTADRYAYLAMAGLAGCLAWLLTQITLLRGRLKLVAPVITLGLGVLCFLQARHWRTPQSMVEYALVHTPENPVALTLLGNEYLKKGETGKAILTYHEALRYNPTDQEALQNLFVIARDAKASKADRLYRHWQFATFGWTYTTFLAGNRLKEKGTPKVARILLETRIKEGRMKATCPDFYFLLGSLYQAERQWEKAIAAYSLCLELSPDKDAARFNLGVSALNGRGFELAARSFEELLGRSGDHLVHYNLGITYLNLKKPKEALKQLEVCHSKNPNFLPLYDPLINAYLLQKSISQASVIADQARLLGAPIRKKTVELLRKHEPKEPE